MRVPSRTAAPIVASFAAAAFAQAGTPGPLEELEGRLALRRAEALAARKLYDRADAILKGLAETHPDLAAEANKHAQAIAAAQMKARGASKAPQAYRNALEESRKTGRPMMVFFGRDACGNCRYTKGNLKSSRLATYKRQIIEVMLDCDARENRPLMSRLCTGKEMRMLPFIFYLSPKEEMLEHTSSAQGVEQLRSKFQSVLRKCRPLSPTRVAKAIRALKKANALMDQGRCGAAVRAYQGIAKLGADVGPVEEAKASLEIIKQLGDTLLEEAQGAAGETKFAHAAPRLVLLQRDFGGTKASRAARAELEKLKSNPEAKDALEALGLASAPPATPGKAPAGKPAAAGSKATAASRLLRIAKNLIANKRPDKAKPFLQRIVQQYPDTDAAVEAAAMLEVMD